MSRSRLIPHVASWALAALCVAPSLAIAAEPSLKQILGALDDTWRGRSSHAIMSMHVKTAHYERTMRMEAWSKGEERSLVRILAPVKEKGTVSLKSGNNLYTYLPKTDRTIRLTSAMMSGSWMGSHFTNDDLVKESRYLDDFDAKITHESVQDGRKLVELTLVPKPDAAVVWGKIVSRILLDPIVALEQRFYDEDLALVRTMSLDELKTLGGRAVPTRLRIVPADKPAEYTELRYERIEFDIDVPDEHFSLATLRQR